MVSTTTFISAAVAAVLASIASAAPSPSPLLIETSPGKYFGQYDLGFPGFQAFMTSGNCQFNDDVPSTDPKNPNFSTQRMANQSGAVADYDKLTRECYNSCKAQECLAFVFVRKNGVNYCQTACKYGCGTKYTLKCSEGIIGTGYNNPTAPQQ